MLNITAIVLTLATVGLLVAARVLQGILLAIAPAMAGLLLFDASRGMAQGWLGAMISAALMPLFVLLMAAIEFAIMMPMIDRLLAEQSAGVFENSSVMPIGLVAVVFAIAIIFGLRAAATIGHGVVLARLRRGAAAEPAGAAQTNVDRRQEAAAQPTVRIVHALEQIARREAPGASPALRSVTAGRPA